MLKVNEKVTLKDLCVGMLLPSGNDAATASAIKIAGSKEKFAELMNKRAKQIGMEKLDEYGNASYPELKAEYEKVTESVAK